MALSQPLGEGWATYGEVFDVSSGSRDIPRQVGAGGGVVRKIGNDVQIDASVGRGMTASAADWVFSGGFVLRRIR